MLITIDWKPDKSSETPLYTQIIDYFRKQIASGNFKSGQRIPSQRDLASLFEVNRSTVNTAIDELMSMGILNTKAGKGTFIEGELWNSLVEPPFGWSNHEYDGAYIENTNPTRTANELLGNNDYFNLGSHDLAKELSSSTYIQYVLKDISDDLKNLDYLSPLGNLKLRKVLVKKLAADGIKATPENILITSGSAQALNIISLALLKRNTTLFSENPSYINTLNIFQSIGVTMKKISMDENGISVDQLSRAVKKIDFPLLYVNPNYQNPTSITMSKSRREELIKCCEDNNIAIIEDDAYGQLWFDEKPPPPLKSIDKNGHVLYLSTISQTISPGLRIGWIVGPETVINRLSDVKMQTDYGTAALSQIIAKRLLESDAYNQHLINVRNKLKQRRDLMLDIIRNDLQDVGSCDIPKGGFYIYLRFNKKIFADKLFDAALKERLLLDPDVGAEGNEIDAIRLSFSFIPMNQMETALKVLRHIVINLK